MPEVCKKCGGKLDPKGNYCMECLQTVHTVDNMDPEPEKRQIPPKTLAIIGGALVFLIACWVYVATRPLPPEAVADKWVNACLSYHLQDAGNYTTTRYEQTGGLTGSDSRGASSEKADEFKDAVDNQGATYTLSKPVMKKQGDIQLAVTTIMFKMANGDSFGYDITLVRQPNRHWLIDRVD